MVHVWPVKLEIEPPHLSLNWVCSFSTLSTENEKMNRVNKMLTLLRKCIIITIVTIFTLPFFQDNWFLVPFYNLSSFYSFLSLHWFFHWFPWPCPPPISLFPQLRDKDLYFPWNLFISTLSSILKYCRPLLSLFSWIPELAHSMFAYMLFK